MNKLSDFGPQTRLAALVLASLGIAGCSTYSGQKLGLDEETKKEIAPKGLPYSLTRPEFTLSRTPPVEGERKATYTLAVAYENDPSQRYDIRISPSPFADASLTVKFTSGGGLSSTTGGITDLLGPTITALGSFAKDVIAASATGAFDQDALRTIVVDKMKGEPSCEAASVVPIAPAPYAGKKPDAVSKKVGEAMADRIRAFKSDDEFLEKFHYLTTGEKSCLQATAAAMSQVQSGELKEAQDGWKKAYDAFKVGMPADAGYLAEVAKAYGDEDQTTLVRLALDNASQAQSGTPEQKEQAKKRQQILMKSQTALRLATESTMPKKLDQIIGLSDAAWTGRHVLYLEREVARIELARIRQPDIAPASNKEISDYVDALQVHRARALGASELHERALTLARFLRQIEKKTDSGGSAPATAEFAVARLELDVVLAQFDARRAKIVAAAAPPATPAAPKISAIKSEPVAVVDKKVVSDSKANGWIETEAGKSAKQFVLVLREVQ